MREDFIHYVWKYQKFNTRDLKTVLGKEVIVKHPGQHNSNSGPDFFNALLKIDQQLWAGNVELHVKSSDWYRHNHENDNAYNNVILHVVWEHDTEVFISNNSPIATLELKSIVDLGLQSKYHRLFAKPKWINCENDFATVSDFTIEAWLERLYFERLEGKIDAVLDLLKASNNDWEAVLFKLLAKNFGLNINGDAFLSIANSFDFSVVRKLQGQPLALEALFLGQATLLEEDIQNAYYLTLVKEYQFIKQKYRLSNQHLTSPKFFRLRPPNFPTLRLSQLAMLYGKHKNLFSEIIALSKIGAFYSLFKVSASPFWDTHYTFDKTSAKTPKRVTKPFIDLLLINTIIPLKFCYAKHQGKHINDTILTLANDIKSESNRIIKSFNALKPISNSALHSQAFIHLKKTYCDANKCLQCAIGNALISS